MVEAYGSSNNEYVGTVYPAGFTLRRRRRPFHLANLVSVIAIGDFIQDDYTLKIETEVDGFRGKILVGLTTVVLFYLFFAAIILTHDTILWPALWFISSMAFIILGLHYLIMRFAVMRMKRILKEDFLDLE